MHFPENTLQLSALPHALAQVCLHVRTFMQENAMPLPAHGPIIVGLSGGADSTALALILRILGYSVHIAHVDHALRPESGQEAEHVKNFAAQYAMPCTIKRMDVQALATAQSIGIEEAGRNARYAFFAGLQKNLAIHPDKPLWIATGHHMHDLAEDMLMRLLRGAGWPALGGMHACIPDRQLMRPLLDTPKESLTGFLTHLGIPWCHDPSNDSNEHTRNRIRHQLMPLCFEENPHFLANIRHLWNHAQDDHAYWTQRMHLHAKSIVCTEKGWLLPRTIYMPLPRAERLRLYKYLLECVPKASPRATTLYALDAARSTSGKIFQFSKACIHVLREGLLATSK